MVGEVIRKEFKLEDVLTEEQVKHIVGQYVKEDNWKLVGHDIRPAIEGMAGFLGDHIRASLRVATASSEEEIKLFIKTVPKDNKPKADFIEECGFFDKEFFVFGQLDELCPIDDGHTWCVKALVYNNSMMVMPDLRPQGYRTWPQLETLDLPHTLVAAATVARFHAACANYETRRAAQGLPRMSEENPKAFEELSFADTPWMRCAARASAKLLKVFSKKYNDVPDLDNKLTEAYVKACDSLREYNNTINVLLHRDLWVNNIMFRYENGAPANAVLVDYQCLRYGPPTFDVMTLLYCTTSRSFREQFEETIYHHYYSVFTEHLDNATKQRMSKLGYDEQDFLKWCETSRFFGALQAVALFPFILMDPETAKKTFDDAETYRKYMVEDRSEPVVEYCRANSVALQRQLEACEEFVERYVNTL